MNAIKTSYESLPESIPVPGDFIRKKGEIIIIVEEESHNKKNLADFFGCLPDFPARGEQGTFEDRESL